VILRIHSKTDNQLPESILTVIASVNRPQRPAVNLSPGIQVLSRVRCDSRTQEQHGETWCILRHAAGGRYAHNNYTVSHNKEDTTLLPLTSPIMLINVSQFFHRQTR